MRGLSYALLAALALGGVAALLGWRILIWMPQGELADYRAPVAPATAELSSRLQVHIKQLAEAIGERNYFRPEGLQQSAAYIRQQMSDLGYQPYTETYPIGYRQGPELPAANIWVELPGAPQGELVIVGAHYDSARGSPGADDNATGVAALLELARLLRGEPLHHRVRFVAFSSEEPPFSHSAMMGSRVHALRLHQSGTAVRAMLSLESLGIFSQQSGSQAYPPLVGHVYPDQGRFIAFISNLQSRPLNHQAIAAFRQARQFPSQGMAAPQWLVPDIARSDHASFWHYGFPAIMVTDTADFRSPYYHTPDDRLQHLDLESLAQVVLGLRATLLQLARE